MFKRGCAVHFVSQLNALGTETLKQRDDKVVWRMPRVRKASIDARAQASAKRTISNINNGIA